MGLCDPTFDSLPAERHGKGATRQGPAREVFPLPESPYLEVRALGELEVRLGGREVSLPYEKLGLLLVYLILEQHKTHQRSELAEALWPNSDDSRKNLSVALFNLRKQLGECDQAGQPLFLLTRETVRFNPDCSHWMDASALASFALPDCRDSNEDCPACAASVSRHGEFYRGEFLSSWKLDDQSELAGWLDLQRAWQQRRSALLLERASACLERLGRKREALRFSELYLRMEPWDESVLRRAMRMLAAMGQHRAALVRCRELETALQNELGETLSAETVELAKRIEAEAGDEESSNGSPFHDSVSTRRLTAVSVLITGLGMSAEEYVLWIEALRSRLAGSAEVANGRVTVGEGGNLLLFFDPPDASQNSVKASVEIMLEEAKSRRQEVRIGIFTGETVVLPGRYFPDALGRVASTATVLAKRATQGKVWMCNCTESTLKDAVKVPCDHEAERVANGPKGVLRAAQAS